ncbi:MAG: hypothetical protein JWN34_3600 [Bryobacterales bacterium]|nr:hypothetical protein [Bryobacterales bacterium]
MREVAVFGLGGAGHGGRGLRVGRGRVGVVGEFVVALSEDVALDAFGAVESPVVLNDEDGELRFEVAHGFEVGEEIGFEGFVGRFVSFGHAVELPG